MQDRFQALEREGQVGERTISDHGVIRVLERLASIRVLPNVIRTDNGKEPPGRAMVADSTRTGPRFHGMPWMVSESGKILGSSIGLVISRLPLSKKVSTGLAKPATTQALT